MFQVEVKTFNGKVKIFKIIDISLAYDYFGSLIQAIDAESAVVLDGLTGEVLTEWKDGKITVIEGRMV